MATEQITLRVPPWVKEYLRTAAFEERKTQTAILVDAIERRKSEGKDDQAHAQADH